MLAERLGQSHAVTELTDRAMNGHVDLGNVYGERLRLLNPTRLEVQALREDYKAHVMPDAREVLAALVDEDVEPWIVSGGLLEPVIEFATWLDMDPLKVRAVGTQYDPLNGNWWERDNNLGDRYLDFHAGHLTQTTGKADVINASISRAGRRILIGDGMSDLKAAHSVDLFVAYAGVVNRPSVCSAAPVVIRSASLAPFLALALGPSRLKELLDDPKHGAVAGRCFDLVTDGAIEFNDGTLGDLFCSIRNLSWEA